MHELMQTIGQQFESSKELVVLGLILARTLPVIFLTPFLGGQMVPSELKMGLSVGLSIIVWPLARAAIVHDMPTDAWAVLLLMMKETLVGFCIGFAASHIFTAMEVAGRIIDTARGAAMGEVMLPSTKQKATAVGSLYQQLLVVFFVTAGGLRIFFEIYLDSFGTIPITEGIPATPGYAPVVRYMCTTSAEVLYTASVLAAPAVAATFITDVVFGILNRVAPQLNAYFLSMPVKAVGALALMLLGMPSLLGRMGSLMRDSLSSTEYVIDLLVKG